ncbi:MAG: fumarylacetoacetate hydrolase family protein [Campylobacteraceae bacterium]|nr:fumarylacetoacetate hydrolase family protein [Campylobacteraceae bacterium]
MKFITYEYEKALNLGLLIDDEIVSFTSLGLNFKDMNDFIISHTEKEMETLSRTSKKDANLSLNDVKLKAPIIHPKQDIICLGLNYLDHAKESYKFKQIEPEEKREEAIYFAKRVNEAVGGRESIPAHANITEKLDYEVELAFIIKKDAKNVKREDAKEYIFGYTILNDISARDVQNKHKQWYFGKSLDGTCPMGPFINTALDTSSLAIKSYVNGELRQNSNTSLMIFDEGYVIEELSKGMTLKAGTIISMGTPSGVGMGFELPKFLKSGDEIVCEIEGLGKLKNYIV